MNVTIRCCEIFVLCLLSLPARGGVVSGSYADLAEGTTIDLTAQGTLDWVKFANGENQTTSFLTATKIGNPIFLPGMTMAIGDPDAALFAINGQGNLNFTWTNGNFGMYNVTGPVDTVMVETLDPFSSPYPIGLGASMSALAAGDVRKMDVYVQGFNADMVITATMSGGGPNSVHSLLVSPTHNPASDPANDYSYGVYSLLYSGSNETLTITVTTQDPRTDGAQADFANAGFFAAAVMIPEPSTLVLGVLASVPLCLVARRRRQRA